MGTELDQVRLAALHQAAHDLKNAVTTAEEVVERANVYVTFLEGWDKTPAVDPLEKAQLIARKGWDFVNDRPAE